MSRLSIDSYESASDSYEQDDSNVDGTQYETDSHGSEDDDNDESYDDDGDGSGSYSGSDGSGSLSGSGSEDSEGWGTGSSRSRSESEGRSDDEENSFDAGVGTEDDDDDEEEEEEEDDSAFWKRYGNDESDADKHENRPRPTGKWKSPMGGGDDDGDETSSGDGFDDEYGLAAARDMPSSPGKRKRGIPGGSLLHCFSCDHCLTKKKRMIIGVVFLLVIIAVAAVVSLRITNKDDAAPAPPSLSPSLQAGSPTAPAGPAVITPITIYGIIPDGQENGVDMESLEEELSEMIDLIVIQILEESPQNVSTSNDNLADTSTPSTTLPPLSNETVASNNQTVVDSPNINGTGSISVENPANQSIEEAGSSPGDILMRRFLRAVVPQQRYLEAVSIETPTLVEVTEFECPVPRLTDEGYVCVEINATITVMTDDGDSTIDFVGEIESIIPTGQFLEIYQDVGGNTTIIFFVRDEFPPEIGTAQPSLGGSSPSPPTVSPGTPTAPNANITSSPSSLLGPTQSPGTEAPTIATPCIDTLATCNEWANRDPSECDRNPYVSKRLH
jgi:hypothetical protein